MESAQGGRGEGRGEFKYLFLVLLFASNTTCKKVKTVRQKDAGNAKNQVLFLSIEKRTLQDVLRWK